MYKEFYGFTAYPFSLSQDPQFLYLSKKHENCGSLGFPGVQNCGNINGLCPHVSV